VQKLGVNNPSVPMKTISLRLIPIFLFSLIFATPVQSQETTADSLAYDLKIRRVLNKVMVGDAMKWVNRELPHFELYTSDCELVTTKDLRGKPTVLTFWSQKCERCLEDLKKIEALRVEFGEQVHFISISIGDMNASWEFLEAHPLNMVCLADDQDYAGTLTQNSFPMTFILDKETKVADLKRWMPTDEERVNSPSLLCDPGALLRSLL